jgi:hypothetical protein
MAFGLTGGKHEQFEQCPREEPCHRIAILNAVITTLYDVVADRPVVPRAHIWEAVSQKRTVPKYESRHSHVPARPVPKQLGATEV